MAEEQSKPAGDEAASQPGGSPEEPAPSGESSGRSASADLAEGLELMLRAARKAMRGIDPGRLEDLGRRAVQGVENLDRRKVGALGLKAARNLDPRRIEAIAEEAGRELLGVVERVAERVESMVSGTPRASRPPAGGEAKDPPAPDQAGDDPPRARVRVDDSDS